MQIQIFVEEPDVAPIGGQDERPHARRTLEEGLRTLRYQLHLAGRDPDARVTVVADIQLDAILGTSNSVENLTDNRRSPRRIPSIPH